MFRRFLPVAALVAAFAAAPAHAQGRRGGFQLGLSPLRLTPSLQTRLTLTADQKSKLQEIQTKTREQAQALFQGGGGQGAFQQFRELNQKAEERALGVFTADQKTKYEGWKTEIEPYQGIGRTHVALLAVTGLTSDQKAKLKELGTTLQSKRQAAFQNGGGGREAFQQLEMDAQDGVKRILNADQQKQFAAEVEALPRFGRRPNAQ